MICQCINMQDHAAVLEVRARLEFLARHCRHGVWLPDGEPAPEGKGVLRCTSCGAPHPTSATRPAQQTLNRLANMLPAKTGRIPGVRFIQEPE